MVTEKRRAKLQEAAAKRQEGVIILEDIYDPHNAQAVFRSAEVFGFQKIALVFDKQKPFDPQRVGKLSSSSANKWLDFTVYSREPLDWPKYKHHYVVAAEPLARCFADLRAEGYEVWGTVAVGASLQGTQCRSNPLGKDISDIYQANFSTAKLAIAFGNEHRGLSDQAIATLDHLVTIPQSGLVESFNLSVAAGIFLYEITRQRSLAGMEKYLLSGAERGQLLSDFEGR